MSSFYNTPLFELNILYGAPPSKAKHSKHATTYMILDGILLGSLTGKAEDSLSVIEGSVCNIDDIQSQAEASQDTRMLHNIYVYNHFISFWKGDYIQAEKHSDAAWKMYPASKLPTLFLIYHTLFRGLVLFQLFRQQDSQVDVRRLKEGIEMMDQVGTWAKNAMSVFENKWLLLRAQHAASVKKTEEAQDLFNSSIKVSRDRGDIHELGLAYHQLGLYYSELGHDVKSRECLEKACVQYNEWGAMAVASQLLDNHDL